MLVANDISPADMLQFKGSVFAGFVTDVGGKTSHTAIVARSMDIPAVVGAREASRLVRQDDWVIIDGDAGVGDRRSVADRASTEYRFRSSASATSNARRPGAAAPHCRRSRSTASAVELLANIELPERRRRARSRPARSASGLFRSEFLFMNRERRACPARTSSSRPTAPRSKAMQGLPVTIRTVDIGADKPLDRMSANELRHEHALNPALGLRAIRWSLSEPAMFRQQLRAILRAARASARSAS